MLHENHVALLQLSQKEFALIAPETRPFLDGMVRLNGRKVSDNIWVLPNSYAHKVKAKTVLRQSFGTEGTFNSDHVELTIKYEGEEELYLEQSLIEAAGMNFFWMNSGYSGVSFSKRAKLASGKINTRAERYGLGYGMVIYPGTTIKLLDIPSTATDLVKLKLSPTFAVVSVKSKGHKNRKFASDVRLLLKGNYKEANRFEQKRTYRSLIQAFDKYLKKNTTIN